MNFNKRIVLFVMAFALLLPCLMTACDFNKKTPSNTTENTSEAIDSNSDLPTEPTDSNDSMSVTEKETDKPTEPQESETLNPTKFYGFGASARYCFKKLPNDYPVQQFALFRDGDGKLHAYAVSRGGSTAYLSEAVVNEDTGIAMVIHSAELPNYGHSESLDVSVRDGEVYVYIGSGANSVNSYAWATTITRLKFKDGVVSDEKVINGIEYASASGNILSKDAKPYRINFAVDNESDLMVMYIRTSEGNTTKNVKHYLTAYKLSDIDKKLDECEKSISAADLASSFVATSGEKSLESFCYNTSFQGMEVDNEGSIYIVGGGSDIRAEISRFTIEDGKINRKRVTKFNWVESNCFNDRNFEIAKVFIEIESVKFFEGELYCSFYLPSLDVSEQTEIFILMEKD